ncbi:molybdate ABC transporter substrate-binding protein [Geomonas terrae]|uniref:Molybdate-binding protein ModA n=1 Tax=Geomonas terrae TaxID=2562681 RepID=A0A4S1CM03_9BACT|nr:molybdate ABC transporter substrate-binding protein [Geomonas terrae]TGU74266.1 molybdate ABC transporter substrate-binding protein [Geomonas terrae]
MKKLLSTISSCGLTLMLLAMPAAAGEITISAAASLKEAVNEIAEKFVQKHPGTKITRNYAASGTLAKQIESGAPADIFISANEEWMSHLKEKKLVAAASIDTFTRNTLVFAGATTRNISGMHDLPSLGSIAIGSPKSVPAGEYAEEAMRKAGLEKQLNGKLILAKDVRESMMYAERGEVDGAFVYRTDALLGKHARILFTVPQQLYPRIVYPMALTTNGTKNRDAAEFLHYLKGREAKSVLSRYGFAVD